MHVENLARHVLSTSGDASIVHPAKRENEALQVNDQSHCCDCRVVRKLHFDEYTMCRTSKRTYSLQTGGPDVGLPIPDGLPKGQKGEKGDSGPRGLKGEPGGLIGPPPITPPPPNYPDFKGFCFFIARSEI